MLVAQAGRAFRYEILLWKHLHDPLTDTAMMAPLHPGSFASVGLGGPDFILNALRTRLDAFLDSYLRVNAAACQGSATPHGGTPHE